MADENVSRPWMWPAEWAVSHSFWREVATRTVAGVLTVVFLGIPGLIYAVSFGALTAEQGWQLGIGLGVVVVGVLAYVVFLAVGRVVTRALAVSRARSAASWTAAQTDRLLKITHFLALLLAVLSTFLAGNTAVDILGLFDGR